MWFTVGWLHTVISLHFPTESSLLYMWQSLSLFQIPVKLDWTPKIRIADLPFEGSNPGLLHDIGILLTTLQRNTLSSYVYFITILDCQAAYLIWQVTGAGQALTSCMTYIGLSWNKCSCFVADLAIWLLCQGIEKIKCITIHYFIN